MPLTAHDPVPPALAPIPDDALSHLVALSETDQLTETDMTLVFMTFGAIARECLRRRQHMRALHELTADNVICLHSDHGQPGDPV